MKHEDRTDRDMSLPPHTQLRFIAKLTYCLPLALLPALTTDAHAASLSHRKLNTFSPDLAVNTTTRASRGTGPYLAVVRPIGIRFAPPGAATDVAWVNRTRDRKIDPGELWREIVGRDPRFQPLP